MEPRAAASQGPPTSRGRGPSASHPGASLTLGRGGARFRTENGPKSLPGYMARTDLSEYRLDESVCLKRGHCGPFLNRGVYDAFPDPRWHGMGECVYCHSTVKISRHEARARSV